MKYLLMVALSLSIMSCGGNKLRAKDINSIQFEQVSQLRMGHSLKPDVVVYLNNGEVLGPGDGTDSTVIKNLRKDLNWQSSNPDIVSIQDGSLLARGAGSAIITASYGKHFVSKRFTVTDVPEKHIRIHYKTPGSQASAFLYNKDNTLPAVDYKVSGAGDWDNPLEFTSEDDFGFFIDVPVIKIENGLNFILRNHDQKDVGERQLPDSGEIEFWLIKGISKIFLYGPEKGLSSASLFNKATINLETFGKDLRLSKEDLKVVDHNDRTVKVEDVTEVDGTFSIITEELDLSNNFYVVFDYEKTPVFLSREIIDSEIFTYEGNDLGAVINKEDNKENNSVTFKLWSPPATSIVLSIYDKKDSFSRISEFEMVKKDRGVWETTILPSSINGLTSLEGCYYQYRVTAYGKTENALDPYGRSMAPFEGTKVPRVKDPIGKAAIVDLENVDKAGKKPDPFLNSSISKTSTDIIVYEIHVRDFTIGAKDVDDSIRGTFNGFISKIPHLKELGITHVQLLPLQSYYSVNELDRSFQDEHKPGPNYNWGYDPHCYFSLEGWLSTNAADPYARIREFRELVDALHKADIGVIVDVVYNHTMKMSVFENAAPGCYHRPFGNTTPVDNPAVESRSPMVRKLIIESLKNLAEEYGVDGFRFDLMGFMDNTTMQEIRKALGEDIILHGEAWNFTDLPREDAPIKGFYESYPRNIELAVFNDTTRNAFAGNMAEKGFVQGDYSHGPRTKAGIIGGIRGFTNGDAFADIDNDTYNTFTDTPVETLQYLTIHDGFTLWDKINLSYFGTPQERLRIVKQAAAMLFTSQGKIIIQGGSEIGRTNPLAEADPEPGRAETSDLVTMDPDLPGISFFHENSYGSSDFTNMIRWERMAIPVFSDLFDYYKGLIKMRRSIPAFRYLTSESIQQGLRFIGEKKPEPEDIPEPVYTSYNEVESLTITFINGEPDSTYYIAGEVNKDTANPDTGNTNVLNFDSAGTASITYNKTEINSFDLGTWGSPDDLAIKLVKNMGSWDTPPEAYSRMGNNTIPPTVLGKDNSVTIDLSIQDHAPGAVVKEYPPYIAFELDNTLEKDETDQTRYTKLVVVHNASDEKITIRSNVIINPQNWSVIVDTNSAGVTPIKETPVKVRKGGVEVPPHSSAVIAK